MRPYNKTAILTISFMYNHVRFHLILMIIKDKRSRWYMEQRQYLSGLLTLDQVCHISIANRVDPDQADLTRAV